MFEYADRSLVVASALLFSVVSLSGCTSSRSFSGSDTDVASGGPNLITLAEIQAESPGSAQNVIQSLRPRWLQSRAVVISAGQLNDEVVGGQVFPVVYLDGIQWGDVRNLDAIDARGIERLEFVSAADATTMYGTGHSGGVIHVVTHRP